MMKLSSRFTSNSEMTGIGFHDDATAYNADFEVRKINGGVEVHISSHHQGSKQRVGRYIYLAFQANAFKELIKLLSSMLETEANGGKKK